MFIAFDLCCMSFEFYFSDPKFYFCNIVVEIMLEFYREIKEGFSAIN